MAHQVVLVADPGIDTAFAVTLALLDPDLEVLGLAATAGNVSAPQATRNIQILVEQIDPPRLPRYGAALSVEYDADGIRLHGPGGLGGVEFPCAELHHQVPADKLLADLVRQNPRQVTVVALGPLTTVARALDRDPELPRLVQRLVCVGGTWHEPGNAGPVSEFHVALDPPAARAVLRSGAPLTLIPLDVSRKLLLAPTELTELPRPEGRASSFLRRIVPYGIGATSRLHGVEGFHLKDVAGVLAVALPGAVSTRSVAADVEVKGELTRGMTVFDVRPSAPKPNIDLAVGLDLAAARAWIDRTLRLSP